MLTQQLKWLIGIRLVVIISVFVPYLLLQIMASRTETDPLTESLPTAATQAQAVDGAAPTPATAAQPPSVADFPLTNHEGLRILAGVVFVLSLLYIALLRVWRGHDERQAYVQFSGDLFLITGLIWSIGEVSNPFSILYLVVITLASVFLHRRAGLIVASGAGLLYTLVLLSLLFGWGPREPMSRPAIETTLTYNLSVHLMGFFLMAVLSDQLVRRASRAEEELEATEEDLADLQVFHSNIIQSIQSGLVTTDLDGRITSVNRAGRKILERDETSLLGRMVDQIDLFDPALWRELSMAAAARPGKLRSEVELSRDGDPVYVGFSVSRLLGASGQQQGYIVIFQDLTRWRHLQEEVRLKDRMAAVGELAAGIAHEIGNPLAAISGSAQLLSSSFEEGSDKERLLKILLKESQRLDRTIKGFLRFARPKDRASMHFDVAALLSENFQLLKNSSEVSADHHLELTIDPPELFLVADPDQISQIFWNLARNALKAMPNGGELRVSGASRGGRFVLSFEDTGRGMSEEERANLFHPFQSFFDDGAGIGMAIVYRIVQQHGGQVSVESRTGGGTAIRVEMPLVPASQPLGSGELANEESSGEMGGL